MFYCCHVEKFDYSKQPHNRLIFNLIWVYHIECPGYFSNILFKFCILRVRYKNYFCIMINTDMPKKVHEGRNVKRFREMLGIKQEALAAELGEDWTQSKISLLEAKETIEPDILEQVAKALKVTPEAIRSFSEDVAINIISNTFNNHDHSTPQFAH